MRLVRQDGVDSGTAGRAVPRLQNETEEGKQHGRKRQGCADAGRTGLRVPVSSARRGLHRAQGVRNVRMESRGRGGAETDGPRTAGREQGCNIPAGPAQGRAGRTGHIRQAPGGILPGEIFL